jgi:hypothetical protein
MKRLLTKREIEPSLEETIRTSSVVGAYVRKYRKHRRNGEEGHTVHILPAFLEFP